jgi:hypothetical protein
MEENVAGYVEDSFYLVIVEYGKYVVGDNFFDHSLPPRFYLIGQTRRPQTWQAPTRFLFSLFILHFRSFFMNVPFPVNIQHSTFNIYVY